MKKIILISVLLNLGLVGVLGYKLKTRSTAPVAETSAPVAEEKTAEMKKVLPGVKPVASAKVVAKIAETKFSWREVESEDYKKYIANLRAIHCPEETVRSIIMADVNKFYSAKLAPYRKPKGQDEYQFWKTGNGGWGGQRESDEFYKMQRQFQKEKQALLKELLGANYADGLKAFSSWPESPDKSDLLESMPQEKKEKLQEVDERYNDLRQAFYRKTRGYQDEDDQAELKKMEKQKHDELAKILTPEELFEREVRGSDLSNNLKWNELRAFDATEEEFRAIFKARQTAEFAQSETSTNSDQSSYWQMRQKAQKEAEEGLKDVLAPDRLAELKLAENYEYSSLVEIAQRNNLPKETAKDIYGMKTEVEKAARDIQSDRSLTSEQRTEKLKVIKAETEKTVAELLGQRGFKSFKRNAWWLRNLVPETTARRN